MIIFIVTKHLQEVFNVPLIIQVTNDEIFFNSTNNLTIEQTTYYAHENIKDIIAIGFDITKTFIFLDTEYISYLYPNICKIQRNVTYNQLKSIFGLENNSYESLSCGKIAYPPIQIAPTFSDSFPIQFNNTKMKCLIPCTIDQDPYFRLQRDIAPKLNEYKCSTVYTKLLPGLRGVETKMSSSVPNSAVFLNDTEKQIRRKIMKFGYSGGGDTKELHRKYGANLDIDVPFQYLKFFMNDDEKLIDVENKYGKGEYLVGEVKKMLVDVLIPIIKQFQVNRQKVTDDIVDAFMTVRALNC